MTQRGPLYRQGYQPQLSGHETFPLRYGWLKKAYDAVSDSQADADNRWVFTGPEAIVSFGVGKNMVASMRYWASAAGIVRELPSQRRIESTELGDRLFGINGFDPFMEDPVTSWLVHWNVCSEERRTTWFWAFHHSPYILFDRDDLVTSIMQLAMERQWPRTSPVTVRRDVSCFLRTYVAESPAKQSGNEDGLESPLSELGLIKGAATRDRFRFIRGPKPTLGIGVFAYAVTQFWNKYRRESNTLSYETLAFAPGSPGRAFMLDEADLVDKLLQLEDMTGGLYRWSETAGLKQLIRHREVSDDEGLSLVTRDYENEPNSLNRQSPAGR